MKNRFFLLLLTVLFTNTLSAQELNNFFTTLFNTNLFNGSAIVSKSGKTILSSNYGFSNIEKRKKITNQFQFPIASITKTFTSTAILQLQQKGKLNINEPVQKYLTDFPYPNITIRQLLNNTSGLAQEYNLFDTIIKEQPEKIISNQDIIPTFIRFKTPLSFPSGSKWEYNNVNFCLAGLIIEKVSGISYAKYLEKNIFKPAKMKNSFVPLDRKIKSPNQVELYTYPNFYSTELTNTKTLKDPFLISDKSNFYGPGGIVSTALDLQKYQKALFNHQILGKKELEEALTATKLNDGKTVSYTIDGKEISYGLGWEMYTDEREGKIVFHDGFVTGLTSILLHNITKNQSVILLSNSASSIFPISNAILNLINSKPYNIPVQNLSRIYGNLIEDGNKEKANQLIQEYLKNPNIYEASERDFNRLGYQFLRLQKCENALRVFNSATLIFPKSWNVFDSYGEALHQCGKKEEAVKMYQKSIDLNPENENGKQMLLKIEKEIGK
ncbi:class A beta-lactamase-related serine hydrolase [Pedobacter sp. ISL-68]|uniref:serine hydrolase n=1 Tax=unclassified Pedobacter TaxID=2628915 RepID=UPI001BECF6C6|nr:MULTISPECIES: serine hydrolase [unclassified Pedobacter]MBT2560498.1 class A beta-lactamase-related serine hydrolase [Pedobacter sp. ISL-64]MBT2593231.1 class A beta-lactamase-related serine hydrolase [Pedobacter sp. ISL-68]